MFESQNLRAGETWAPKRVGTHSVLLSGSMTITAFEPWLLANSRSVFLVGSNKVYVHLLRPGICSLPSVGTCCVKPGCWCGLFPILGSPSLCEPHCGSVLCARDHAGHFTWLFTVVGKILLRLPHRRVWKSREINSVPEFL